MQCLSACPIWCCRTTVPLIPWHAHSSFIMSSWGEASDYLLPIITGSESEEGWGQETWTELSGVIIPLFDKGQNWPKELKRYFLSIWFRKKAWKWTVTFFLFIWNQFLCFLSVASSNGSEEGLARKLGRKYPESLAEKKTEGVFCPFTEEGQEGFAQKYLSHLGICKISNTFVSQVLSVWSWTTKPTTMTWASWTTTVPGKKNSRLEICIKRPCLWQSTCLWQINMLVQTIDWFGEAYPNQKCSFFYIVQRGGRSTASYLNNVKKCTITSDGWYLIQFFFT